MEEVPRLDHHQQTWRFFRGSRPRFDWTKMILNWYTSPMMDTELNVKLTTSNLIKIDINRRYPTVFMYVKAVWQINLLEARNEWWVDDNLSPCCIVCARRELQFFLLLQHPSSHCRFAWSKIHIKIGADRRNINFTINYSLIIIASRI